MNMNNTIHMDDGRLFTKNMVPGTRVYDEELHNMRDGEHRLWDPRRSKLGSYLVKGGRHVSLEADSTVLYLGAANGTTPSHVSDIIDRGTLVGVEFSPRSFRDLVGVADRRPNLLPVLADAWQPEKYERFVGTVDLLFQDIAQRQQAAIFAKNINRFKPDQAMIAVKARSVDVAADPRSVYTAVAAEVADSTEYDMVDMLDLGPFERDHAALIFKPGTGKAPRPRPDAEIERRDEGGERDNRGGGYNERRDSRGPPPKRSFDKRGGGGRATHSPGSKPKKRYERDDDSPQRRPGRDKPDRRGWN